MKIATSRGCSGGSEMLVELKRAKRRRLRARPTDFACPCPFLYGCGHMWCRGLMRRGGGECVTFLILSNVVRYCNSQIN